MASFKFGIWFSLLVFSLGCAPAPEQGLEREPVDLSKDADVIEEESEKKLHQRTE